MAEQCVECPYAPDTCPNDEACNRPRPAPSPAGPERETVEAAIARVESHPVRNVQTRVVEGYMLRSDEWREIRAALRHGVAAAVDEARREGAETALREAADEIAGSFPLNGELRYDGSADPQASAYVEGLHDAHQIVRARADALRAATEGER